MTLKYCRNCMFGELHGVSKYYSNAIFFCNHPLIDNDVEEKSEKECKYFEEK